jgi:hypothetical protein
LQIYKSHSKHIEMQKLPSLIVYLCLTTFLCITLASCSTSNNQPASTAPAAHSTPMVSAAPASTPAPAPAPEVTAPAGGIYRIKAGADTNFVDSAGNVWLADQGFSGGDTVARDPSTQIANTKDPGLFLNEHYGMDYFSCQVPNGKYTANLYFAETFDGISGPGQRVFSFSVMGHDFKDFDVWVKAGGPNRAYVESVPVEVTNGVFRIDFTASIENPEINAIELIPQP